MSHSLLSLRHQIRYLFSVTFVGTGHQARASVVDLWTHDVCSDCLSLFPAAQVLSWDSRRAFHRSPPNEIDSHAPSSRRFSVCVELMPVEVNSGCAVDHRSQRAAWCSRRVFSGSCSIHMNAPVLFLVYWDWRTQ